jgi:hypothetical protein
VELRNERKNSLARGILPDKGEGMEMIQNTLRYIGPIFAGAQSRFSVKPKFEDIYG